MVLYCTVDYTQRSILYSLNYRYTVLYVFFPPPESLFVRQHTPLVGKHERFGGGRAS